MTSPAIPGYSFDECRGSGAFGSVWAARWNGEFGCAVKALTPGTWHPHYLSWCLERLRRESEHPGLVRIYSYDLTNDPPHLSMALLPEGTLSLEQLAGRLPPRDAWRILDSLAGTLAWLHHEGIVHTGLSTRNVFVCPAPSGEPAVLVSDVGQGWLTDGAVSHLHGQIGFIAPEHWRSSMRLLQEGRALGRDVYAFGVVAWRLLTGSWPRGAKVFDAILASQTEDLNLQPGPFADWLEKEPASEWNAEPASPEERERRGIVEKCLAMDPAERFLDLSAAVEALKLTVLPPAAEAAPVEAIALETPPEAADTNGDGKVDSADAFAEPRPDKPPRRKFALPKLTLSLGFRRNTATSAGPRSFLMPAVAGFSALALAGVTAWAFKERSARVTANSDLAAARSANADLSSRIPRAETDASNARSEAIAARAEQVAAARHSGMDLIGKVLATKPVEEDDLSGWRAAVRAVAEQCAPILENAPADAFGMEARWQLARLKTALGEEDAALPVLEKLNRDLEATAIEASGNFPAELVRLTGRVEALAGRILSERHRLEDALPHLRKASDSFEKWLAGNPADIESSRECAHNLLLEGLGLAERGQPDQARGALMKIAGLVGKPNDPDLSAEDRFLLADSQFALGRLDAREAARKPTSEPGSEEASSQLLESAITQHMDAVTMLLAYDDGNKRSISCRARMARGYFDMARFLTRRGNARDASAAFGQSILLYTELTEEQPGRAEWIKDLAMVYNETAQLIRQTKPGSTGAKEALEYQNFSVTSLQTLNSNNTLDNSIRTLLAASIVLNGELLQDSGDTGASLKRHTEAITLTTELLGDNALSENERRDVRRLSARAWTAAAGLHERAGRREETVAALTKAYADWESAPVEDPSDQKLMAWVKEKLDKLKPR